MIPLRDNIPSRTTPFVTYLVMLLCGLAFFAQLSEGKEEGEPTLVERLGMIPVRVIHPDRPVTIPEQVVVQTPGGPRVEIEEKTAAPPLVPAWLTPLTCIFLHGGWMHLLGNMWFLWIFGDNVEDRFGHVLYALFYLGSGAVASLTHLWADPSSSIPTIGASGAIAGVMGAYLVFYPHAKVFSIIPLGILFFTAVIPAPVFLGIWFVIQIVSQTGITGGEGVAWWAHIGGFVVGAGGALITHAFHVDAPPVQERLPNSDRYGYRTQFKARP